MSMMMVNKTIQNYSLSKQTMYAADNPNSAWAWSSLVEGDECSTGPSGKLLCYYKW